MVENGDPDGDTFDNRTEFENGTHPQIPDTGDPPPEDSITIGPGPVIGVLNGQTNYQEFTDWTLDDLLVLDEYEGDGNNNQQGDVFPGGDGFDSSRDIVAFYARDGGALGAGGDDTVYFRVDMHDLQAFAEDANLDLYVVIDTGVPGTGERKLPDDVDAETDMQWEAVVALYQSNIGAVLVDTMRAPANNTATVFDDLNDPMFGVERRDQNHGAGFKEAYYNSELDAIEFSVRRQALLDAGWNGLSLDSLNFQVFTTRDGTSNNPVGAGDIGGRNDVRDAIFNDYMSEDHFQAQQGLDNIMKFWIPGNSSAGRSKFAMVVHGNQSLQPGSVAQGLINNGAGAGYFRAIDSHDVFGQALNLHVSPTLASSIQWASVDPALGMPWLDGPAFNDRVASLVATGTVRLLAGTMSDHMMPYFPTAYNQDNIGQATGFLNDMYGVAWDGSSVFWIPGASV